MSSELLVLLRREDRCNLRGILIMRCYEILHRLKGPWNRPFGVFAIVLNFSRVLSQVLILKDGFTKSILSTI